MSKKQEVTSDGLKFLQLELSNFKNIDKKVIDIGGRSLFFMGKNGSGKSSLIQALTSPLDTKTRPSKPIKNGETHSSVIVTLGGHIGGEERQYILELYFSPKNETGRLVVTDMEGTKLPNPAGFVKGLIGNCSFDVMNWLTDTKAKRLEKIKELTGCAKDIDLINISIKEKKELKSKRKEKSEELESILKNHAFTQDEIDKYSHPIDLSVLQTEMQAVSEQQEKFDAALQKIKGFKYDLSNTGEKIVKAEQEIVRLKKLIEAQQLSINEYENDKRNLLEKVSTADKWLETAVRPSGAEISQRMIDANVHNEKYNSIKTLSQQSKDMVKFKEEVQDIDVEIKKLEGQRSAKIKSSQLPIEGFEFDDDNIYLNGIPIEEGGLNTASLIDVSVQMALHQLKKSNLKVIFINDCSLLDKNTLHKVIKEIEEQGVQVIAEIVDFEGNDLQVKFSETEL